MKDYRKLWKKPHLVAGVMAGTAGILAAAALGVALLVLNTPTEADRVESGPVEGCEVLDRQNDMDTLSFRFDPSPEFDQKGNKGNLYLENPRENQYDLQADIELEDGTVVYSSPVLEPDSHIDSVTLTKELEGGVYPAQIRLFAVDRESGEILGYVLQPMELRIGDTN